MAASRRPAHATLRAFVAAARHESVTQAAQELGVTPSAVSHQIRILEEWVGAALFGRASRALQLTSLGRGLLAPLSASYDAIAHAVDEARQNARDAGLRVSALPLFTAFWLIPRLERFHKICEEAGFDVSIEVDTSSAVADFETAAIDLAIRNLQRPTAALITRKLLDLTAVPLCSAAVAGRLSGPRDLADETLIHISGRRDGWHRWLDACGAGGTQARKHLSFDTLPAALEAAAAGRGVMLGLDPLIWDAPAASRLLIPFKTQRVSAGSYCVVYRRGDRMRRTVRLFADWICAEMKADRPRLARNARDARSRPN